jgi:hypothetical protein
MVAAVVTLVVLVGAGGAAWYKFYANSEAKPATASTVQSSQPGGQGQVTSSGASASPRTESSAPAPPNPAQPKPAAGTVATVTPLARPTSPAAPPPVAKQPAPTATLVVLCNLDCVWSLDGQQQDQLAANRPATTKVGLGSHTISASTLDNNDSSGEMAFVASSPTQPIVQRVDLLTRQTQRLQAEAVERARQAEASRQAEIARQAELERQRIATAKTPVVPASTPLPASSLPQTQSSAGDCQLKTMPQVWRNVATNGRYRFRFDCQHIYIYELTTTRIVADLTLKPNKKDSSKDKYVGSNQMARCAGGKMEIQSITPTRIDARYEKPDVYNRCPMPGVINLFPSWESASFIPE